MADIKKVKLGNTTYNIVDEWARRRLEGAGTIYSITVNPAGGHLFWDIINNESTGTASPNIVVNNLFGGHGADLPIEKSDNKLIILLSTSVHNDLTYQNVVYLKDLVIGDSIFVKEYYTDDAGGADEEVPDRWYSSDTNGNWIYSTLQTKPDLSDYAKTGTYNTSTPNSTYTGKELTIDTVAQSTITTSEVNLGSATGSATVKKQPVETGSAGAHTHSITPDKTTTMVSNATLTGEAGTHSHTFNPSNSTKTVVTSVDSATGSAGGHSHTVNISSTTTRVSDATATGSAGAHTHSVELEGTDKSVVVGVDSQTGSAGGHSHTFNPSSTTKTVVTEVTKTTTNVANTGSASTVNTNEKGAHTHSIATVSLTYVSDVTATGSAGGHTHNVDGHTHTGVTVLSDITDNKATITYDSINACLVFPEVNYVYSIEESTTSVANTGSAKTLTAATAGAHTHSITPNKSTQTVSTASVTGEAGAHTHNVTVHTHTAVEVVNDVTTTKDTLTYATGGTISSVDGHTHSIGHTSETINIVSGGIIATESAGAHTHSIATKNITYVTGATTSSVSGHTHSVGSSTTSLTYVSGGTIGSSGNHSHSVATTNITYVKDVTVTASAGAHTHSVVENTATETISLSVAVGKHSHTIGKHSHTLSDHTHSVTI